MNVKTKCMIAENVGEILIGGTIGVVLDKVIYPKCNKRETLMVTGGALIGAWMIGRTFGKMFYEFCDDVYGTNFMKKQIPNKTSEEES